jgi:hypothetical protein
VDYTPESAGEIVLDSQTGATVRTFTVKLSRSADRKEVEFSAYAFNVERVKSATDRKTFSVLTSVKPVKGRAYLITVGVNAYENPAWDLRFAANDARQLARTPHMLYGLGSETRAAGVKTPANWSIASFVFRSIPK